MLDKLRADIVHLRQAIRDSEGQLWKEEIQVELRSLEQEIHVHDAMLARKMAEV